MPGINSVENLSITELLEKKDVARIHLGRNLSLLLEELNITNQHLTELTQTANPALGDLAYYESLTTQIKKLQENSLKMSSLISLGFELITERDSLQMLKTFSRTAGKIIKADSVAAGIIKDVATLSGQFCIAPLDNKGASQTKAYCSLDASLLEPLLHKQRALRLPALSPEHLIPESRHLATRAFLGVPISFSLQKYGLIYFIGKANGLEFSVEDERIAITMAAEFSVLHENIQLYETIQQHALTLQQEIAERKRIESDLCQSKERLNLALEAGQMNAWEWNIQTNQMNEFGYFDLLSHSVDNSQLGENQGTFADFSASVIPEDRTKVLNALEDAIKHGVNFEVEFRSCLVDGSIHWIAARGKVFVDERGQPQRMVGVGAIITERKKTEELARVHQAELAQVARVNSMGEMASTLAHELNQPLTVINTYISGCIYRLEEGLEDKAPIVEAMKKAMQNVELAGEIIHRMKNFVREGELNYEKFLINVVINEVVSLIHYEMQDSPIVIHVEFDENMPLIEADKIQIEQVLLNLIRNALEAMHNAKTLKPTLIITAVVSQVLTVCVSDNGSGIESNVSKVIFSPYFTTKQNGMGMGLAICRTIIEAHGGQLSTFNRGDGACFQFTLPLIGTQPHE